MQHISKTQFEQFQTVLLNSFAQLRKEMTDILVRSTDLDTEQLEKISTDELLDLAAKLKFDIPGISRKISEIKSVDAALNNMQLGMYGLCADCEEEIAIEQLKIDATRQRCLKCEHKYQKQKYNNYKL